MEEQQAVKNKTKTLKSRRESAVQGTNDSSIVSKCSMANLGYFDDPYLQCFVSKVTRRAPLIHRGYYVRAKTLDYILKSFLKENDGKKQILSLGAGFDSAYFRLYSQSLLKDTVFYEIDFPEVVKRRHSLIRTNEEILHMIGEIDPLLSTKSPLIENAKSIAITRALYLSSKFFIHYPAPNSKASDTDKLKLSTACYKLIGVDLSQLNTLEAVLNLCNIDLEAPTLCLSECVMTYMTRRCASNVVRWAAETFNNSMFVLYEQINPNDAFGLFMQNHFHTVGSPLKSINAFPTLQAQRDRFTKLGWNDVTSLDMNQFYFSLVPTEERERIENMEPFDEYEEWHLKCAHYMVLCGYHGNCSRLIREGTEAVEIASPAINEIENTVTYEKMTPELSLKLFGHGTAAHGENGIVCVGGFGEQNGKHMRVTDVTIVDKKSLKVTKVKVGVDNSKIQGRITDERCSLAGLFSVSRMHATVTYLKDGRLILIGGRLSPMRLCTQIVSISIQYKQGTSQQEVTMETNQSTSDEIQLQASKQENGNLGKVKMSESVMNNEGKSVKMNCVKNEKSEMNIDEKVNSEMNCDAGKNCMNSIKLDNSEVKSKPIMNCDKNSAIKGASVSSNKENNCDLLSNKENEILNRNPDEKDLYSNTIEKNKRSSRKPMENLDEVSRHLYDENVIIDCTVIDQTGDIPSPRWRHSAVLYQVDGEETVILFGGRTQTVMALGDCYKFVPRTAEWSKVNAIGQMPSPRHSHTASFWNGHMIIAGGLEHDLHPLSSIYMLDLKTSTWKLLSTSIKPRYSHSAHVIDDFLVLVGGVNCHHSPPGVAVVHIPSGICVEFALPKQDKENLIMLHRHTSVAIETYKIVVLGGGGNCFSFGTHLNSSPFVIDISKAINYMKTKLNE